eukprot:403368214
MMQKKAHEQRLQMQNKFDNNPKQLIPQKPQQSVNPLIRQQEKELRDLQEEIQYILQHGDNQQQDNEMQEDQNMMDKDDSEHCLDENGNKVTMEQAAKYKKKKFYKNLDQWVVDYQIVYCNKSLQVYPCFTVAECAVMNNLRENYHPYLDQQNQDKSQKDFNTLYQYFNLPHN